jgi:hypothetical protein
MADSPQYFPLARPGSLALTMLFVLLVVLPLGLLLPVYLFAGMAVAAIATGILLACLFPVWILLAYCLLVRHVRLSDTELSLRSGPWKVRVARKALQDATIREFDPASDSPSLGDKRISGISIGTLAIGRFRGADGKWVFKLLFGGKAVRITDRSGTRLEIGVKHPQRFLDVHVSD